VDYDPSVITYKDLLDAFWNGHDPGRKSWTRQYMSMILYHDPDQEKEARESKAALEKRTGRKVHTVIEPYSRFYLAENYHQKYRLKMESGIMSDLGRYYPDSSDLTHSTAAARINGFLYGYGEPEFFEEISGQLGLSDKSLGGIRRALAGR